MSEPPIPIDSRVVLKGGYEVVYPSAWAGSEGWIRKARVDEYGFDQVYVEWDKEHWRYDGELDCWTFPNHFRVIEDPVVEETPELATTPSLGELGEEQAPCPDCGEVHPNHIEWADYFDTLMTAADKAADADNFVLMTVAPTEGDPSTLAPRSSPVHSGLRRRDDLSPLRPDGENQRRGASGPCGPALFRRRKRWTARPTRSRERSRATVRRSMSGRALAGARSTQFLVPERLAARMVSYGAPAAAERRDVSTEGSLAVSAAPRAPQRTSRARPHNLR